jgi:hypothetical protein
MIVSVRWVAPTETQVVDSDKTRGSNEWLRVRRRVLPHGPPPATSDIHRGHRNMSTVTD